ncbi:hypothetical protein Agub_g1276 [Astrephomene gubernaculifera]|uniref:non-specific serine/threonine protein kinase n=1 Tax=Astrephomene gubernaculifera TaxID=47775 RepID=A0AAD3HHL7_9CHLO|nr:hypothetical protein Agub_g1276 [Astrephomene gubernaculifera]
MSAQARELVRRAVTVLLCGRTAREEASLNSKPQPSASGAPLPAVPLSELSARMQNIPSPSHPPITPSTEEQEVDYALVQSVVEQAVRQVRATSSAASLGRPRSTGEVVSRKFWQEESLGYGEVITDGFYDIHGDYPEVCEGADEFPSLADLRKVRTSEGDVREVVVVDHEDDSGLLGVEETLSEAMGEASPQDTVARIQVLASVVCERFGGVFDSERTLEVLWRANSANERRRNRSVVLPLCGLETGAGRHRALLFKVLADALKLPCKLIRGATLCGSDSAADAVVQVEGVEYVVDLVIHPGRLMTMEQYAVRVQQRRTATDSLPRSTSMGNAEASAAAIPSAAAMPESTSSGSNHVVAGSSLSTGGVAGGGGAAGITGTITPTASATLPSGPLGAAIASPADLSALPAHNSPRALQFRPPPLAPPVPPPLGAFGNPPLVGNSPHVHAASRFMVGGGGHGSSSSGSGSGPAIAGSRIRFAIGAPTAETASQPAAAGKGALPLPAVGAPASASVRAPASSGGGGVAKMLSAPPVRDTSSVSGAAAGASSSGRQSHVGMLPNKAHSMNDLGVSQSHSQGAITPTGSGAGDLIRFDSGSLAENLALSGLEPAGSVPRPPVTPATAPPAAPAPPSSHPPHSHSQHPHALQGSSTNNNHTRQESFDQNGWVKFGGSFGRVAEDIQSAVHAGVHAAGPGPSPLGLPNALGSGCVTGGFAAHPPPQHAPVLDTVGSRDARAAPPGFQQSAFANVQLPCAGAAAAGGVGAASSSSNVSWSVVVSGAGGGRTSAPGGNLPQQPQPPQQPHVAAPHAAVGVPQSAFWTPARASLQGLAAAFPEMPPQQPQPLGPGLSPLVQQAPGAGPLVGMPATVVPPAPGYSTQAQPQLQPPIRPHANVVAGVMPVPTGNGRVAPGMHHQPAQLPKPVEGGNGSKAPSPPPGAAPAGGDGDLFRDLSPFVSQQTRSSATSSGGPQQQQQQPEEAALAAVAAPGREPAGRVSVTLPPEPQPQQPMPVPQVVEPAAQYQDISPTDLTLIRRIGGGSYGTVYRGTWRGTEVAVKLLGEQNVDEGRIREFQAEVTIMNRLRHPNIVLFMGAVTTGEQLAIVTEFVPRGSLFRLLHDPNATLDARRRLNMARDIAKGMEYLHSLRPPVVHRDLKSPNLLVDRQWTVKVCDFGLSRTLSNTYLTAGTQAGTAEWMAPEVLRSEVCDEKCDVFSFGVIMYELVTGRKPWEGLNVGQVVAEVAFKHRRLTLPAGVEPTVRSLIESCWANDPRERPSFTQILAIMAAWTELRLVLNTDL